MNATDNGSMDIAEIMRYLPHRYPFLLVDRVTALVTGKSIRGYKNVTMNEPFFVGSLSELSGDARGARDRGACADRINPGVEDFWSDAR